MKQTLIIRMKGVLTSEIKGVIQERIENSLGMTTLVLDESVTDLIVLKENGEYDNIF